VGLTGLSSPVLEAREPDSGEPLRTAASVRRLTAIEAGKALPVRLEGVVVALAEGVLAFVLMDQTDGIYVTLPARLAASLLVGDWVELEGLTEPGDFAPIVRASALTRRGVAALPPPMSKTLAEVATGGYDAKWVEVEGVVRDAEVVPRGLNEPWTSRGAANGTVLLLAWADTRMRVRVQEALDVTRLIDARVRVRGVCFNLHTSNRQFVRASLQASGREAVSVLVPPPIDPFSLPLQRAGELLQFDPEGFSGHRVRVKGVVTHQQAGDSLWIRDGDRGLRVVSDQAGQISPGEEVETVGFIDRGGYSPSLSDAVFRRSGVGLSPVPIWIDHFEAAVVHEADLIQIESELNEIRDEMDGIRLMLDWNGGLIEGVLAGVRRENLPVDWQPGSRVRVSGICVLRPQTLLRESGLWSVDKFQVIMRNSKDLEVVVPAPWWTTQRTTQVLGGSAAVLTAVILLIGISWRRQIGRRETERKMAEAEFSAILGERNRMARDIHDTLAQGLNAVSMQLELAKNASEQGVEKSLSHVATAHVIVRSCLSDARESIWNMRSHALEKTDLVGALDDVLRRLSAGLTVEAQLTVAGRKRRLAPQVENDLLRIGQEAISNAIKHSGASRIAVGLEFTSEKVSIKVTDDGRGFDSARVESGTGHFGLAGIRERVAKMNAELRIASTPTGGTALIVEVESPDGSRHGGLLS